MRPASRRRLLALVLAAALAVVPLFYLAANVFFQPERLVRKLEKRLNCRASIGAVDLSLFSQPARLVIHDLALAERDEHARRRTPLAERPPLADPLITAEKLSLTVSLPHLLAGQIHAHELTGTGVHGKLIKPAEGDHSFDRLFAKPDEEDEEDRADGEDGEEEGEEGNTIDRLKIPATLRRASLVDASLVIEVPEKQTRITWQDIEVALTDVEISPSNLEEKNRAHLTVNAKVSFDHLEEAVHYGAMIVQGDADVRPVDPQTRELKPEATFRLRALEGSYVETAPLIDAMAKKLEDLKKYGLRFDGLELAGALREDAAAHGHYRANRFTLEEPTQLHFGDYQLGLAAGSWYESEENLHEFHSRLTLGPGITERILGRVDSYLADKVGFLPPDLVRRFVGDHFLRDGHFILALITVGDIGRPKVTFSEKLPEIDIQNVKDSAESLIKDLKSIFR